MANKAAAGYAKSLGLDNVIVALFVSVDNNDVIAKLSGEHDTDGVKVTVAAIPWTWGSLQKYKASEN